MRLRDVNRVLSEAVKSVGGKWVKPKVPKPKHKGKEISFAELDGPHSTGPGGRGEDERGEYTVLYLDKKDNEIGVRGFRSRGQAVAHLNKLAKAGVEVGSLG